MATCATSPAQSDIWLFMKQSKATHAASLKVLQTFVLSLSKQELSHILSLYLKSCIIKKCVSNPTYSQAASLLINDQNATPHSMDDAILDKMNTTYGKKYQKQIVAKLQQHHSRNQRLLRTNPQILASSFQYLTFKEMCKLQATCSYFTYLRQRFPSLCHYYIDLDHRLLVSAMTCKLKLGHLAHFKHIKVSVSYRGSSVYDCSRRHKRNLFNHILQLIVQRSAPCLDKLEIDSQNNFGDVLTSSPYCILSQIMDMVDTLPITTLVWNRECVFNDWSKALREIGQDVARKFPNLRHVTLGGHLFWNPAIFGAWALGSLHATLSHLGHCALESVHLQCRFNQVFKTEYNIFACLGRIATLKHLSIASQIDASSTFDECISDKLRNVTLESMKLDLLVMCDTVRSTFNAAAATTKINGVLKSMLSVFVGIKKLELEVENLEFPICDAETFLDIAWTDLFRHLLHLKAVCDCDDKTEVSALQSLHFRLNPRNAPNLMTALMACREDRYFDLQHFGLDIARSGIYWRNMALGLADYALFVDEHLVKFLRHNPQLKSLFFSYFRFQRTELTDTAYIGAMINVLDNIPDSLVNLSIAAPNHVLKIDEETKEKETNKLAQRLVEMSMNAPPGLEVMSLNNFIFCNETRKFLTFWFGFNNKFHAYRRKYYFYFK